MKQFANPSSLLEHLRSHAEPFTIRRTDDAPRCADLDEHVKAYEADPAMYALCGIGRGALDHQRARILYVLLSQSRVGLPPTVDRTLKRVAALLLTALPVELVLNVFIALRRARANHKHTTRAMTAWLLNHPQACLLVELKQSAMRDSLEHALGRDVARACAKHATGNGENQAYLRRHLLKFAADPDTARLVVMGLYAKHRPGRKARAIPPVDPIDPPVLPRARTITTTSRGEIAATLVQIYREGESEQLRGALQTQVESAARDLPRFDGSIVIVLDASASMRGYGEREYAFISQSYALALLLRKCCKRPRTLIIGGAGDPPLPAGDTDLANGLLRAVAHDPDLVAVISDGYENVAAGDFSRVAASLPKAGVSSPVVFCQCKFTEKDDLMLRRPTTSQPTLEFWHQDDFPQLLWSLFNLARGNDPADFLRRQLENRLARLEKERKPWITL